MLVWAVSIDRLPAFLSASVISVCLGVDACPYATPVAPQAMHRYGTARNTDESNDHIGSAMLKSVASIVLDPSFPFLSKAFLFKTHHHSHSHAYAYMHHPPTSFTPHYPIRIPS